MHRFCIRFIFIALMMVPHILQSMLVENIESNCCEHKKKLDRLSNKGGIQKIQYVQLKKITKGKLGDKKYMLGGRSRFQQAGESAVLILRGIKLRNCEILQNLKFEKNIRFHRNNTPDSKLPEIFFSVENWKNFHKKKVRVRDNGSNTSDNLAIYNDALYIDMINVLPGNNVYLSSKSDYMSLIKHVRELHKKENHSFAILARLNIHNDDISHENFLPIAVNKVGDVLEYVGTKNIFYNSDESHWKDIFHKVRKLVEKPKELEELIVRCVQSEAKKEIDEMGLGDIAKEAMDPELQQVISVFKPYSELTINDVTKIKTTILKQELLECKSKFRSHLKREFCIGSIFGSAVIVFGFILLRLCGFKYVRM